MREFSKSDSAQAVDLLYGEALFAEGEYFKAGTEYSRAAYSYTNDPKLSAQAGQDAIVAFDSATVRAKGDRAAQDSLFAVVDRYVAAFPSTDVAHHALIEKGKRASEAQRWDVMAATFKTYADNYPNDPYTPTAQKLIGDALYKQGLYTEAQGQWENAQAIAIKSGKKALSDTITLVRNAAAVTYGDSLVKAGNYREAAEAVYVAFADRNPTSDRAPDALRNAIETYVLADSVARVKGDTSASKAAKQRALELSQRLVTSYPTYKYRVQYQALQTQLLADLGKRDEAAAALETLIHENPTWPGRADAMVRLAVDYDSLGKPTEEAAAYERFAAAYPKDARAADAQYNAGVSYLQGADTAGAIRAYGSFAAAHPRDPRVGSAQATRVALIKAGGNVAAANVELAKLCARPTEEIKTQCAARAGENEFAQGRALFPRYQALKLIIPLRVNLTRAGVERLSAPKRKMLADMSTHFTKAIASGDPTWLSAASYYVGLAQWEYGNYLANLTLPKDLSDEQRAAAQAGSARQAEQYYQAANKLWQTLVDKAATDKFDNAWVQRAKDAIGGKVDASPPAASLGARCEQRGRCIMSRFVRHFASRFARVGCGVLMSGVLLVAASRAEAQQKGPPPKKGQRDRDPRAGPDAAGGDGSSARGSDVRPAAPLAGVLHWNRKHGVRRSRAAGAGESDTRHRGTRHAPGGARATTVASRRVAPLELHPDSMRNRRDTAALRAPGRAPRRSRRCVTSSRSDGRGSIRCSGC